MLTWKTPWRLYVHLSPRSGKLVDLEHHSRSVNRVGFGMSEAENETDADLQTCAISEALHENVSVKCTSLCGMHRLGRKGGNRPEGVSHRVILY